MVSKTWIKFFENSGVARTKIIVFAFCFETKKITLDQLKILDESDLRSMKVFKGPDIELVLRHAREVTKKRLQQKGQKIAQATSIRKRTNADTNDLHQMRNRDNDNQVMTKSEIKFGFDVGHTSDRSTKLNSQETNDDCSEIEENEYWPYGCKANQQLQLLYDGDSSSELQVPIEKIADKNSEENPIQCVSPVLISKSGTKLEDIEDETTKDDMSKQLPERLENVDEERKDGAASDPPPEMLNNMEQTNFDVGKLEDIDDTSNDNDDFEPLSENLKTNVEAEKMVDIDDTSKDDDDFEPQLENLKTNVEAEKMVDIDDTTKDDDDFEPQLENLKTNVEVEKQKDIDDTSNNSDDFGPQPEDLISNVEVEKLKDIDETTKEDVSEPRPENLKTNFEEKMVDIDETTNVEVEKMVDDNEEGQIEKCPFQNSMSTLPPPPMDNSVHTKEDCVRIVKMVDLEDKSFEKLLFTNMKPEQPSIFVQCSNKTETRIVKLVQPQEKPITTKHILPDGNRQELFARQNEMSSYQTGTTKKEELSRIVKNTSQLNILNNRPGIVRYFDEDPGTKSQDYIPDCQTEVQSPGKIGTKHSSENLDECETKLVQYSKEDRNIDNNNEVGSKLKKADKPGKRVTVHFKLDNKIKMKIIPKFKRSKQVDNSEVLGNSQKGLDSSISKRKSCSMLDKSKSESKRKCHQSKSDESDEKVISRKAEAVHSMEDKGNSYEPKELSIQSGSKSDDHDQSKLKSKESHRSAKRSHSKSDEPKHSKSDEPSQQKSPELSRFKLVELGLKDELLRSMKNEQINYKIREKNISKEAKVHSHQKISKGNNIKQIESSCSRRYDSNKSKSREKNVSDYSHPDSYEHTNSKNAKENNFQTNESSGSKKLKSREKDDSKQAKHKYSESDEESIYKKVEAKKIQTDESSGSKKLKSREKDCSKQAKHYYSESDEESTSKKAEAKNYKAVESREKDASKQAKHKYSESDEESIYKKVEAKKNQTDESSGSKKLKSREKDSSKQAKHYYSESDEENTSKKAEAKNYKAVESREKDTSKQAKHKYSEYNKESTSKKLEAKNFHTDESIGSKKLKSQEKDASKQAKPKYSESNETKNYQAVESREKDASKQAKHKYSESDEESTFKKADTKKIQTDESSGSKKLKSREKDCSKHYYSESDEESTSKKAEAKNYKAVESREKDASKQAKHKYSESNEKSTSKKVEAKKFQTDESIGSKQLKSREKDDSKQKDSKSNEESTSKKVEAKNFQTDEFSDSKKLKSRKRNTSRHAKYPDSSEKSCSKKADENIFQRDESTTDGFKKSKNENDVSKQDKHKHQNSNKDTSSKKAKSNNFTRDESTCSTTEVSKKIKSREKEISRRDKRKHSDSSEDISFQTDKSKKFQRDESTTDGRKKSKSSEQNISKRAKHTHQDSNRYISSKKSEAKNLPEDKSVSYKSNEKNIAKKDKQKYLESDKDDCSKSVKAKNCQRIETTRDGQNGFETTRDCQNGFKLKCLESDESSHFKLDQYTRSKWDEFDPSISEEQNSPKLAPLKRPKWETQVLAKSNEDSLSKLAKDYVEEFEQNEDFDLHNGDSRRIKLLETSLVPTSLVPRLGIENQMLPLGTDNFWSRDPSRGLSLAESNLPAVKPSSRFSMSMNNTSSNDEGLNSNLTNSNGKRPLESHDTQVNETKKPCLKDLSSESPSLPIPLSSSNVALIESQSDENSSVHFICLTMPDGSKLVKPIDKDHPSFRKVSVRQMSYLKSSQTN